MTDDLNGSTLARGGKSACGFGIAERRYDHEDRNVDVGSCPSGQLDGDQGEKAESRSSERMIRFLAPALLWMTCITVVELRFDDGFAGRPWDQRGGRRKQSWRLCWENLDRDCCSYCAGIAETTGDCGVRSPSE